MRMASVGDGACHVPCAGPTSYSNLDSAVFFGLDLVLVDLMDARVSSEVESVCSSAVKTVVDSGMQLCMNCLSDGS